MTRRNRVTAEICTGKIHLLTLLAAVLIPICILIPFKAVCQQGDTEYGEDARIDSKTKTTIVDSVTAALHETYVFPDVAKKIEKHLKRKLRKKSYTSFNTLDAFTEQLTNDLQEISSDKHLRVRRATEEELNEAQIETPTDEDIQKRIARYAYRNFGFEKVERLSGNIGYVKFNMFADTEHAGETAIAAMRFITHCDAVIIDLRDNGGGSPSMVQLVSSYFLEEPTHLNSFYIRKGDKMQQFWSYNYVDGERMVDVPLYILTSRRTFSAAEEFTYNMKNLERATIVGETTMGGAHPTKTYIFTDLKVTMSCPFGRAINPISGTNWEGIGIEPHIKAARDKALDVARLEAMKALAEKMDDKQRKQGLEFAIKRLEAMREPADVDAELLKIYAGVYGPRRITVENDELYYQREGRPKYKLIPVSESLFCFEEIDNFMLKVETDEDGHPIALVGIYDSGRTDRSPRSSD